MVAEPEFHKTVPVVLVTTKLPSVRTVALAPGFPAVAEDQSVVPLVMPVRTRLPSACMVSRTLLEA